MTAGLSTEADLLSSSMGKECTIRAGLAGSRVCKELSAAYLATRNKTTGKPDYTFRHAGSGTIGKSGIFRASPNVH